MTSTLDAAPRRMTVTSTAFKEGLPIPRRHTCQGADTSPSLAWKGAPPATKSLALIMDDPDAPGGTWTHWVVWNLPADCAGLAEAQDASRLGARLGATSFQGQPPGYGGPCPPSGKHRYVFRVYALDAALRLDAGAPLAQVVAALKGHVLAWGQLMGTYQKA